MSDVLMYPIFRRGFAFYVAAIFKEYMYLVRLRLELLNIDLFNCEEPGLGKTEIVLPSNHAGHGCHYSFFLFRKQIVADLSKAPLGLNGK